MHNVSRVLYANPFKPFFETYIGKKATIITDEWRGYLPMKKDYPNLSQIKSDKGKSFQDIHIHIMNLKGWLRGNSSPLQQRKTSRIP